MPSRTIVLELRQVEQALVEGAAVARDALDIVRLINNSDGVLEVVLDAHGLPYGRVHEVLVGAEDDVGPLRERRRRVVGAGALVARLVAPREAAQVVHVHDARQVLYII